MRHFRESSPNSVSRPFLVFPLLSSSNVDIQRNEWNIIHDNMNDFMTVIGVIRLILFENERFFSSNKSVRTFHNNEVINHVIQDFQPLWQEFEFIVKYKPVNNYSFTQIGSMRYRRHFL